MQIRTVQIQTPNVTPKAIFKAWQFLACAALVSCCLEGCMQRDGKDQTEGAAAAQQLRHVAAALEMEAIEHSSLPTMAALVTQLASKRGFSFFRSETRSNVWLQINPDLGKWVSPTNYPSDVAIYYPKLFYQEETGASTYTGIGFAGEKKLLRAAPGWKPVPVWTLASGSAGK